MNEQTGVKKFDFHKVFAAIGIVLIAIIIIGGGIWYFVQSAQDKVPAGDSAPIKVSTSSAKPKIATSPATKIGWKTYTSTRDGYSIEYPPDWILIPEKTGDGPYIRNIDPTSKPAADLANGINYPKDYYNLRILRESRDSGEFGTYTVKDWYDKLGTSSELSVAYSAHTVKGSVSQTKVNGLDAKQAKSKADETDQVIYILKDPFIYQINIYPFDSSDNKIIKTMLSTFKFL